MNPIYQAMMAQDPLAAQQQQMANFQPSHLQPQPQLQIGNSMGQMMQMAQNSRDNRIDQVHAMGGGAML